MKYCLATTSEKPNMTDNWRHRKLHQTKDGKTTICNKMVQRVLEPERDDINGTVDRNALNYRDKYCKVCFTPTEREE